MFKLIKLLSLFQIILFISIINSTAISKTDKNSLKVFLEKLEVNKNFEYHKVFNKDYEEDIGKKYYWNRKSWANASDIKSTIDAYINNDSVKYFTEPSNVDKNTVYLKLELNSFYIKEKEKKAIIDFNFKATNYQDILLKQKKHAKIDIPVVSYSVFNLTKHVLAINLIEKLKNYLKAIDVSKVRSYKELNIGTLASKSNKYTNDPGSSPLVNNSVIFTKNDLVFSGILISKTGYILTDYRAFRFYADSSLKVYLNNGDSADAELKRVNKIHNLALVKLKNIDNIPYTPINISKSLQVKDQLKFWGTPGIKKLINSYNEGIVSAKMEYNNADYYFVDTMPHWGYTGTGIYNKNFNLAGIALMVSYDDKFNLVMPCIATDEIQKILNINFTK